MTTYTVKDVLNLDDKDLLKLADPGVKERLGNFIREFNKREWAVRIANTFSTFEDYVARGYQHQEEFGTGFVVDGRPVPYFHPNRSFHDEIIWLNSHLYYKTDVTFDDKLVNSAVVKFYGPARTLDIITGNASDLDYLIPTESKYINFPLLEKDPEYEYILMCNIETAFARNQKIWGTTELRTSLQTASRNYCRENPSPIDLRGVPGLFEGTRVGIETRRMRPSDMIHWIRFLSESWIPFYHTKPTMKESFEFLEKTRGIANYYGYHFSSNLARMPGVGAKPLVEAEYAEDFKRLCAVDLKLTHGNLDENADYVVAGPGATATLSKLFAGLPISIPTMMKMIIAIRNHQADFFGITGNDEAERHLKEASELGTFTTFGIEISCCQFNVFNRAKDDSKIAMTRANAPISKISKIDSCDSMSQIDLNNSLLEW